MSSKPGGKSGTRAPEHTFEEAKYLKRLIEHQVPVRVQLEQQRGSIGNRRVLRRFFHPHHPEG